MACTLSLDTRPHSVCSVKLATTPLHVIYSRICAEQRPATSPAAGVSALLASARRRRTPGVSAPLKKQITALTSRCGFTARIEEFRI